MNKIKLATLSLGVLLSTSALSAVDCYGVPSFVKMGEYGNQEAYIIIRVKDKDYRLGIATDDNAKIRLSIAQSALMADKEVKLRFWHYTSCDDASANRAIPNSFQLVK